MSDLRLIANVALQSLVRGLGCYDAVASIINARWGGGASKGTISKKMSGQLDWTISDVVALEDASGQYPVTRALARRLVDRPTPQSGCLVIQSGAIARESGEAISAILAAEQSLDAQENAQAIREVDEAIQALQLARSMLVQDDQRSELRPVQRGA